MNTQVRPPMDPRIRHRRMQVRRQEGRRRLRVLVAVTSVTWLVAGGWAASRSPLLDVDRIEVSGTSRTTPAEVEAASGIRRGQALLDIDEGGARESVESLPWVEEATVRRHWPGSVAITVVEREPAAMAAAAAGGWALIDRTGQVTAVVEEPPGELLALAGLPPAGPPGSRLEGGAQSLLTVVAAVPERLRPLVRAVSAGSGGEVELSLHPEGAVRLGSTDDLARKMSATLTVLEQVDASALAVLDVSVPHSPVLTRRNGVDKVSTLGTG